MHGKAGAVLASSLCMVECRSGKLDAVGTNAPLGNASSISTARADSGTAWSLNFHPIRRHVPDASIKVDLGPPGTRHFDPTGSR